MIQQTFFRNRYCRVNNIVLIVFIGLTLCSCSPQVNIMRAGYKKYPAIENDEPVVFYNKAQEVPVESEKIGELQASSQYWMNCDSTCLFTLAEEKIKKVGGNALLLTKFEKPARPFTKNGNSQTIFKSILANPMFSPVSNPTSYTLNGDVFFVSDFSSLPDTAKKVDIFSDNGWYLGFGVGPETGISVFLPKFSYYNFQNRKYLSTYYGVEGSVWIIHALFTSLDCLYGIKKDIFTFDTSVGAWWYPKMRIEGNPEATGPYFHTTLNPKIGFKIKSIWVKGGPSFHFYKDYPKDQDRIGVIDLVKIGKSYFNFEILIKI